MTSTLFKAFSLNATTDNPGARDNAFCELNITASIPYLSILTSSAKNALIASTTKTKSFSLQSSESISMSYNCPIEVSSKFTSKPVNSSSPITSSIISLVSVSPCSTTTAL